MVDIAGYIPESIDAESLGINEKVCFSVLREILDKCGDDVEALTAELSNRVEDLIPKHITLDDIFATVSYFINLCEGVGEVDDIDHLGNRRIRSVGELLQNQFRIGFARMERVIRERMGLQSQEGDKVTPNALINIRPVICGYQGFFGSSHFHSSWIKNNPLQSLLIRRLSALGPGSLSRDRASFGSRCTLFPLRKNVSYQTRKV